MCVWMYVCIYLGLSICTTQLFMLFSFPLFFIANCYHSRLLLPQISKKNLLKITFK